MAESKENRKSSSIHKGAKNSEKSGRPQGERNYYQKEVDQFKGKFEGDETHNSFCLTACGCFERHNLPREAQYLSEKENHQTSFATFNKTEYQERQLINMVAFLQKQGCSFLPDESLEQYVMRNKDKLSEQHMESLERSMEQ